MIAQIQGYHMTGTSTYWLIYYFLIDFTSSFMGVPVALQDL